MVPDLLCLTGEHDEGQAGNGGRNQCAAEAQPTACCRAQHSSPVGNRALRPPLIWSRLGHQDLRFVWLEAFSWRSAMSWNLGRRRLRCGPWSGWWRGSVPAGPGRREWHRGLCTWLGSSAAVGDVVKVYVGVVGGRWRPGVDQREGAVACDFQVGVEAGARGAHGLCRN
jgi:hypothetical protein